MQACFFVLTLDAELCIIDCVQLARKCVGCRKRLPLAKFRLGVSATTCFKCLGTKRAKLRGAFEAKDWLWRYPITRTQRRTLHVAQGNRCAICRAEVRLYQDHCHKTGIVRGLLCHSCNVGLGFFADDPALLASATAYLIQEPATRTTPAESFMTTLLRSVRS